MINFVYLVPYGEGLHRQCLLPNRVMFIYIIKYIQTKQTVYRIYLCVASALCNRLRSLHTYIARVIKAMLNINVVLPGDTCGLDVILSTYKNKTYIDSHLIGTKPQAVHNINSQCYEFSYWLLASSDEVTAGWRFIIIN